MHFWYFCLFWYRCYYPHWSRDSVSPICGIFYIIIGWDNKSGVCTAQTMAYSDIHRLSRQLHVVKTVADCKENYCHSASQTITAMLVLTQSLRMCLGEKGSAITSSLPFRHNAMIFFLDNRNMNYLYLSYMSMSQFNLF